jgi:hypothetical protein
MQWHWRQQAGGFTGSEQGGALKESAARGHGRRGQG